MLLSDGLEVCSTINRKWLWSSSAVATHILFFDIPLSFFPSFVIVLFFMIGKNISSI